MKYKVVKLFDTPIKRIFFDPNNTSQDTSFSVSVKNDSDFYREALERRLNELTSIGCVISVDVEKNFVVMMDLKAISDDFLQQQREFNEIRSPLPGEPDFEKLYSRFVRPINLFTSGIPLNTLECLELINQYPNLEKKDKAKTWEEDDTVVGTGLPVEGISLGLLTGKKTIKKQEG